MQDELLENEELYDEDYFNEDNEEDGYFQVEILCLLKAENKKSFTMLELLMKIQNQLRIRELGDHIFFEGIGNTGKKYNGIPVYYLYCGS